MAREFTHYYAIFTISVFASEADSSVISGKCPLGCRFEKTFLDNNKLYSRLGLYKVEDLPEDYKGVPPLKLRNYSDAASLGAMGEVNFILCPVDPAVEDPTYGKQYKTYIPFSSALSLREVGGILSAEVFTGPSGTAKYKVLPGSIIERRGRKTVSRIG